MGWLLIASGAGTAVLVLGGLAVGVLTARGLNPHAPREDG
jgi:hypothetical protein